MTEPARPGSNSDERGTSLLEALWRGDELAAALRTAREERDAARLRLARAEEMIAELVEIGDAAQAAIEALRAASAGAEAEMRLYRSQRDALAAELFALVARNAAAGGAAPARRRSLWRRTLGACLRRLTGAAAKRV